MPFLERRDIFKGALDAADDLYFKEPVFFLGADIFYHERDFKIFALFSLFMIIEVGFNVPHSQPDLQALEFIEIGDTEFRDAIHGKGAEEDVGKLGNGDEVFLGHNVGHGHETGGAPRRDINQPGDAFILGRIFFYRFQENVFVRIDIAQNSMDAAAHFFYSLAMYVIST